MASAKTLVLGIGQNTPLPGRDGSREPWGACLRTDRQTDRRPYLSSLRYTETRHFLPSLKLVPLLGSPAGVMGLDRRLRASALSAPGRQEDLCHHVRPWCVPGAAAGVPQAPTAPTPRSPTPNRESEKMATDGSLGIGGYQGALKLTFIPAWASKSLPPRGWAGAGGAPGPGTRMWQTRGPGQEVGQAGEAAVGRASHTERSSSWPRVHSEFFLHRVQGLPSALRSSQTKSGMLARVGIPRSASPPRLCLVKGEPGDALKERGPPDGPCFFLSCLALVPPHLPALPLVLSRGSAAGTQPSRAASTGLGPPSGLRLETQTALPRYPPRCEFLRL